MCPCVIGESYKLSWGGLWCPSIRGESVDGAHGDGGLRRSIPDSGGVRW